MPKKTVIDSGPLIALFDKDDKYHNKALSYLKNQKGELISNYAVITEVTHMLDFSIMAQSDFLRWVMDGGITIHNITKEDLSRILDLVAKYSDLPMDFADASLVVLCERLKISEVASVDKDFSIYRMHGNKPFKNIFPR